jgi:hypothetical protein
MKLRVRTSVPLLAAAMILAGVAQAKPPLTRNVPTEANFGVAVSKGGAKFSFRHGMLSCVDAAHTDCTVANMPLISQWGPSNKTLRSAVAAYIQKYVVASGPNKGKVMWAEPQNDDVPTTAYTPDEFVENLLGNGCYLTSLTTISIAVLANTDATPTSRVATFNAITANSLFPGSKHYNQLLWQYRLWADILQPNKADPKKPSPGAFLGFDELAADLTPNGHATIPEVDNLSDAGLIDAMKHNKLTMLSYTRYRPKAVLTLTKGIYTVTLEQFGQHKVAVSGFQPGSFPVTVNDVGDGKMRRAHIARALSNLKWSFKGPSGPNKPVSVAAIKWDPKFVNQPMLVHEGTDQIALNDPDAQIIIIDGIDEIAMPPAAGLTPVPCGPKSKPCVQEQKTTKPPPVTKPPEPTPAPVVQPR